MSWASTGMKFCSLQIVHLGGDYLWLLWRTLHGRSRLSGDPLLIGYGVWMARDTKLSELPGGQIGRAHV